MAKVVTDTKHYIAIADALREKTGDTLLLKPSEMATEVEKVYDAGKTKEWSDFWDEYLMKGTRQTFYAAFYGAGWNDKTFKPKYVIKPVNAQGMFNSSKITTIPKDAKGASMVQMPTTCTNMDYMFQGSTIKSIDFNIYGISCQKMTATFKNALELESIRMIDARGCTFIDTFLNTPKLKEVRFFKENSVKAYIAENINFKWSPLLSKESIVDIVDALYEKTTGKTLTLSQVAVNNAFETSAGSADGSTSSEWLSLTQKRPTWTISLV